MKRLFGGGYGCLIVFFILNLSLGAFCFDYTLSCFWGTDVHWVLDMVGGAFLGEITIPSAIVCAIVKASGVETPFFGNNSPAT